MKSIYLAALALASAVPAGAAQAEEFDGPYAGVQLGWNEDDVGTVGSGVGRISVDKSQDSFAGGGYIGYDFRVAPKVVLGVEGDIGFAADDRITRKGRDTISSLDPKRSLSLSARAGYIVADGTLAYIRGGYTNARVRASLTDADGTIASSSDRDAWLVGGGVEKYIMPDVSVRLEYRYTDLSDGSGKFDRHQALAGVSYRF
jgi:outer membrane immunogenic protein